MKKINLFAALILMVTFLPVQAFAWGNATVASTANGRTCLRAYPEAERYDGFVYEGQAIDIKDETDDNYVYVKTADGRDGWLNKAMIVYNEDGITKQWYD